MRRLRIGMPGLALALWCAAAAHAQERQPGTMRVAVFNIRELSCEKIAQRRTGGRQQVQRAAEILRRAQPDVVLVNEIDYDTDPNCAHRFAERYLANQRADLAPLDVPHLVYLPVNTGVPSGLDFDKNGATTDPEDAFGFGRYPGQYGMALFSRYPIESQDIRTFQKFLWKDMPGRLMPDGHEGRPAHYSPEAVAQFRLSSKSHWDVPVRIDGRTIHLLASHPTPTVFDGPEDFNGRRNFDEIRLWADYISGGEQASYIVDDEGRRGGLDSGASFVVLGDLNADPLHDPAPYGRTAISQLLDHPRIKDPRPLSQGDWPQPADRPPYRGDRRTQTAAFGRVDYVLPSGDLEVTASGVWYPPNDDPLRALVTPPDAASDHALVWIDVRIVREDVSSAGSRNQLVHQPSGVTPSGP
jgi:endonuclease/exonuclease/phosphatase family metal-dependent hydrolase